jgi:hypothetical protein
MIVASPLHGPEKMPLHKQMLKRAGLSDPALSG